MKTFTICARGHLAAYRLGGEDAAKEVLFDLKNL